MTNQENTEIDTESQALNPRSRKTKKLTYSQRWYRENKERAILKMREYTQNNKEAISEYKHNWYLQNRGDRKDRPERIAVACSYCGKELLVQPNIHKRNENHYCDFKCRDFGYRESQKGDKSHFWKGGKTKESRLERTSAKYKAWRTAVFKRDNYICQICGKEKNRCIHAHHIKSFAEFPKLRYIISNGLTACIDCHSWIHGRRILDKQS